MPQPVASAQADVRNLQDEGEFSAKISVRRRRLWKSETHAQR